MKMTITLETDETVSINTEAETCEDLAVEFAVIFGGMVACIKDKFGDVAAATLIATAYHVGREILTTPKGDSGAKIAQYKETK